MNQKKFNQVDSSINLKEVWSLTQIMVIASFEILILLKMIARYLFQKKFLRKLHHLLVKAQATLLLVLKTKIRTSFTQKKKLGQNTMIVVDERDNIHGEATNLLFLIKVQDWEFLKVQIKSQNLCLLSTQQAIFSQLKEY